MDLRQFVESPEGFNFNDIIETDMEQIEVRLLPEDKDFLPGRFKVCADLELLGQKPIERLTDEDKIRLGRKISKNILELCPGIGSILMTVDGVRENFVNFSVYTKNQLDIRLLFGVEGIYPHFACDISDPKKPILLSQEEWLKK